MAELKLPYTLKEGTVAYAAKVMGDLNVIVNFLNNISLDGATKTDLESALQEVTVMVNSCIKKNTIGNANEVIFDDGYTMQEKLDNGDLNGTDGVTAYVDGWAAFEIDEYGHLLVTTSTDDQAFTINESGNLIYTIPDPDGGENVQQYDLGKVMGPMGPAGEVSQEDMVEYVAGQIGAIVKSSTATAIALIASWDSTDKTNEISCDGITATNNFIIDTNSTATEEQSQAWEKAKPKCISQTTGTIIVKARGIIPTIDIPLQVTINI